jgi:hypothetical protein
LSKNLPHEYKGQKGDPVFKTKNAGMSRLNESMLFTHIHKHSFGGLGADFCESTPFLGGVGLGGLSCVGFFKG